MKSTANRIDDLVSAARMLLVACALLQLAPAGREINVQRAYALCLLRYVYVYIYTYILAVQSHTHE
jgi:hypothetical protein